MSNNTGCNTCTVDDNGAPTASAFGTCDACKQGTIPNAAKAACEDLMSNPVPLRPRSTSSIERTCEYTDVHASPTTT